MFGGEVMIHDEFPEHHGNVLSPLGRGGASVTINIDLPKPSDVDTAVARAEVAGATVILEPDDMCWGDAMARCAIRRAGVGLQRANAMMRLGARVSSPEDKESMYSVR